MRKERVRVGRVPNQVVPRKIKPFVLVMDERLLFFNKILLYPPFLDIIDRKPFKGV